MTGMGIGRWRRSALLVMACVAGGGAAAAIAAVPGSDGAITACLSTATGSGLPVTSTANLTVIDPAAGQTCLGPAGAAPTARTITWNVSGPPGPPGAQGPPGAPGAPGATGPAAPTATITRLTSPFLALPPRLTRSGVGTLTLGSGRSALSFPIESVIVSPISSGAGGAAARRTAVHEIQITKLVDKASAKLFAATTQGSHFKLGTIVARGAHSTIVYDLHQVLVSSFQLGGSGGGAKTPLESITLSFASEQIQIKPAT